MNLRWNTLFKPLAFEATFWGLLCAAFLQIYVLKFGAPNSAIVPHLILIGSLIFFFWCVRLTAYLLVSSNWVRQAMDVGLFSTFLFVLASYYASALIGLANWGRVTTITLVKVYVAQAALFLDVVGISITSALLALSTYVVIIVAVSAWFVLRCRWIAVAHALVEKSRIRIAVPLTGLAVFALLTSKLLTDPWSSEREPISLTLFPIADVTGLQNHTFSTSEFARRQHLEDEARRGYERAKHFKDANVIVIVVDAFRADRVGLLGGTKNLTPNIDRYFAPGVNTFCAESYCGLLGLASSRYVYQFTNKPITIQEVLREHGYSRHFILSGDHTSFYGLKSTYGETDTYIDALSSPDKYANDDRFVLEKLREFPNYNGRPAMFQFHLMSAHVLGKRLPAGSDRAPKLL
jgi:glucan phosphoethanolaminetransferase (alkaline phosphatase superfamily)